MITLELSNEEKIKIYTLAKELYIKQNSNPSNMTGMCYSIKDAMIKLGYDEKAYCIYTTEKKLQPKCFSDFFNLKPQKKLCDKYYWWPLDNTKIRIKMFDLLITQLTDESK